MDNDLEQQSPASPDAAAPDAQATAITPDAEPTASDSEVAAPDADGVPPASTDHVIERRSFGREDASQPMTSTVITTRDSLRASLGE